MALLKANRAVGFVAHRIRPNYYMKLGTPNYVRTPACGNATSSDIILFFRLPSPFKPCFPRVFDAFRFTKAGNVCLLKDADRRHAC